MSDTVTTPENQAPQDTGADDAAFLAELEQLAKGEQAAGEPEEPAEAPEPEADESEPESDKADEEAADEPEESEEDAEDAADETEPDTDPETAKRLETIRKQEKRSKEAIERERQQARAEIEQARQELAEQRKEWEGKLSTYEQAARRAAYDPAGALAALGVELSKDVAMAIYAASPEGQKDPRVQNVAKGAMAQKQTTSELEELRNELKQLKQQQEQERIAQQHQREAAEYLDTATKAIAAEETPLLARWNETAPDKVRSRLEALTIELAQKTGELPDHADVVRELETRRQAELKELGIDPSTVIKTKPKTKTQTAGETKSARTISSDLGTPTKPRSEPQSEDELDADIIRRMQMGEVE